MTYPFWRRLRGVSSERPDLVHVGKQLLAMLQARRSRGGPRTLVQRFANGNGDAVTAGFIREHPFIDVQATRGGKVIRRFREYMATAELLSGAGAGFCIYHMADYQSADDGATLEVVDEPYERIFQSAESVFDAQGLAVNATGTRLHINEFGGFAPYRSLIFDISNPEESVQVRQDTYPADPGNLFAEYAGKDLYIYGTLNPYDENDPSQILTVHLDDGDPLYHLLPPRFTGGGGMSATPNGDFMFVTTEIAAGQVYQGGGAVGALTAAGQYAVFSNDGARLFVTGAQGYKLQVFDVTADSSGRPLSTAFAGEAYVHYEAQTTIYRWMNLTLSSDGRYLFAGYSMPGNPARDHFWRFEVDALPGIGNMIAQGEIFLEWLTIAGAERFDVPGYLDAQFIGLSADDKRAYLYVERPGAQFRFAVYDIETREVLLEVPFVITLTSETVAVYTVELPPIPVE
jgi:hypothetical protein